MISTRSVGLLIDTVVCLTLAKWETVSGRFGGYFSRASESLRLSSTRSLFASPIQSMAFAAAGAMFAIFVSSEVLVAGRGRLMNCAQR
jgi:hypothetical protein